MVSRACEAVTVAGSTVVTVRPSNPQEPSFALHTKQPYVATVAQGPPLALPSASEKDMSGSYTTCTAATGCGPPSATCSHAGALSVQHVAPPVDDQKESSSPSTAYAGSAV